MRLYVQLAILDHTGYIVFNLVVICVQYEQSRSKDATKTVDLVSFFPAIKSTVSSLSLKSSDTIGNYSK